MPIPRRSKRSGSNGTARPITVRSRGCCAAKVHTVRWSAMARPTGVPLAERHGIAFIGGYGHPPNLDAARWLISEIMPRVRERDPALECLLVGGGLPEGLRQRCGDGVVALGLGENLAEIFDRGRLTPPPLPLAPAAKANVLALPAP